ncbi:hypothetical protein D7X33_19170, partial [Butyricicoccus sp. 1XD8-22]
MQAEQLNLFELVLLEEEQRKVSNVLSEPPVTFFMNEPAVEEETHDERYSDEDVRHEAQANRKISYDVGVKVGGARKDLAALRKIFEDNPSMDTLRAVEEEDAVAAAELVTRDVFFNWFSMEVCSENDVDVKAAYGMYLMIRRIPKSAKGLGDREAYINALSLISDEMKNVRTFEHFSNMYHRFATLEMCNPSRFDVFLRRIDSLNEGIGDEDDKKILAVLRKDLCKYTGYTYLVDYYNLYKWEQLGKFYELIRSSKKLKTFNTSINKYRNWNAYFEANPSKTDIVDESGEQVDKPKRSNKPVWERILPQNPTNNSPHKIEAFKAPEDFRQYFKFRAVEYGNYVNDSIGFKHMNNCAQGYVDLAEILNVPHDAMSLGHELAMAFGARGKGRALGHFERGYNIINLTRDKGSLGILSHEWFHGYDRFLNRILKDSDDGGLVTELDNLYQLPANVQDAARMLVSALKEGRSDAFVDVSASKRTYSFKSSYRAKYEEVDGDLKLFMDNRISEFDDYTERSIGFYQMYNKKEEFLAKRNRKRVIEIRKWAEALSQYHYEVTGELVTLIPYTSNRTRVYNVAIDLDRGNIGKYWSSNVELAARAFEYYVSEKLKENGWRN